MCSGGYPGNYEIGYEIQGLDKVKHSNVLFAGAEQIAGKVVTNSGRVLNVGCNWRYLRRSRKKVYEDAKTLHFDYAFYREDIGKF